MTREHLEAMPDGATLIAAERQRQIAEEGWMPDHDDEHTDRALARAAARYAEQAGNDWSESRTTPYGWPWDVKDWKPTGDAVRDLVKAGALIAAEIDRLQRARASCPDCVGGERIINPDWPSGSEPYSEKCATCGGGR